MRVRSQNDLAQWIKFFLVGVAQTAEQAAATLLQGLFKKPVVSIRDVQAITGLSPKAAGDLVDAFTEHAILVEITGFQRNHSFVFKEYVGMFQ